MEAVLSRLRGLSPDELREEFARADVKCGPITATTRATFERKLARVLAGPESSATETENHSSTDASGGAACIAEQARATSCAAVVATTSAAKGSKPTETASEELDFGYGVGLNPPEEEEISVKASDCSAEGSNFQSKSETPSKPAQVSPTFYYGVCPPWEDVLARNGMTLFILNLKYILYTAQESLLGAFKSRWELNELIRICEKSSKF